MQYQTHMFRGQPDGDAIKMLQEFEAAALARDPRGYCVCTSEGKDSRIVGHLMRRAGVKHFYLHSITGIDPPELIYFQRRNFAAYRDMGYLTYDVMWRKSMWQMMIDKGMPPLRTIRYCCVELKERKTPEQGDAIVSLGVRRHESVRRKANRAELEIASTKRGRAKLYPWDDDDARRVVEHCAPRSEIRINPIAEWTDDMVWDYSREAGLEQCCLYQEGFDRLGCIGCPVAREAGRRREFEHWPGFERIYRKAFARMYEARIAAGKPVGRESPDEWFEWWMSDAAQEAQVDGQLCIEDYLEEGEEHGGNQNGF